MSEVMWETPPLDRTRSTGGRQKYAPLIEALRARRGEWAVLAEFDAGTNRTAAAARASAVNTGRTAGFTAGEFEAQVAPAEDGGWKVYVRAVSA